MTTITAVAATVIVATTLTAPAPPPPVQAAGPWIDCATAQLDAACAHLARAERMLEANRHRAAGRELQKAIQVRRTAGQYPGEELWRLAAFRVQTGRDRSAVRTLDELAAEARRAGDLHRQAMALTEAIVLLAERKDRTGAAERLERLQPLLASPYLPVATHESIRGRLVGV